MRLTWRPDRGSRDQDVSDAFPLPIQAIVNPDTRARDGLDYQWLQNVSLLAAKGRVFYASASAANTTVTGQTSFAATTPTFLIDVPAGTTCIPLMYSANQTGSVAGGDVQTIVTIDNIKRFSSGGTLQTVLNSRTGGSGNANNCKVYASPTATAIGTEVRLMGLTQGPDVSPAEGAIQEVLWVPTSGLDYLVGPAAFLVYTYAGTTGPTWFYTLKWGEVPTNALP